MYILGIYEDSKNDQSSIVQPIRDNNTDQFSNFGLKKETQWKILLGRYGS